MVSRQCAATPSRCAPDATTVASDRNLTEVAGLDDLSPVYEFDPTGTLFARPVTITLPVPGGASAACIYFSRLDNTGFDPIGGTLSGTSISSQTAHLGLAYVGPQCATRTVTGVGQITWLSASARISEPIDFSTSSMSPVILCSTSWETSPGPREAHTIGEFRSGVRSRRGEPEGERRVIGEMGEGQLPRGPDLQRRSGPRRSSGGLAGDGE